MARIRSGCPSVKKLALAEFKNAAARGAPRESTSIGVLDAQLSGQVQDEIEELTRTLQADPAYALARLNRAWAFATKTKDYQRAGEDFLELIRQNIHDAEAHAGLAYVRACQGERDEALAEAAWAMHDAKTNFDVLHNVACAYRELSRAGKQQRQDEDFAISLLTKAVELSRQQPNRVSEIEVLRVELPNFPASLRARTELGQLLGISSK